MGEATTTGILSCLVFNSDTPSDVLVWITDNHNDYNRLGGSATSFIQLMEKVEEAEAAWKVNCKVKSITVDSLPTKGPYRYEKVYSDFILSKFRQLWKNWDHYQSVKACRTKLIEYGLFKEFKEWAEANANFGDRSVENHILAEVHNNIMTTIKFFSESGAEPAFLVKHVAMVLLKMATPTHESDETKLYHNTLAIATGAKAKRQLSGLRLPMGTTMLYKKAAKAAAKKPEPEPSLSQDTCADAATVAKPKAAKGKAKARAAKPTFEEDFSVKTKGGSREKLWLDDLLGALMAPVQALVANNMPLNDRAIQEICSDAIRFMVLGTLSYNGKELRSAWGVE